MHFLFSFKPILLKWIYYLQSNLLYQEKEERLYFFISGLSASIEATVDLYYGTVQGVLKLSIKNLGVDLRTDPTKLNNIDAMHIDYRLHLSDAEITADLNTMKDTTMLPSNFGHELGSVLNSASGSYKIAASRLLENVFDERSSTFVDEFLSKLGNEYQIPTKRSLGISFAILRNNFSSLLLLDNYPLLR